MENTCLIGDNTLTITNKNVFISNHGEESELTRDPFFIAQFSAIANINYLDDEAFIDSIDKLDLVRQSKSIMINMYLAADTHLRNIPPF